MTTKEIGHLMFVIPACFFVAWAIGAIILCCWEVAKIEDSIEAYLGNPNSIKHRVWFFVFMLIALCMTVGALLHDHS